MVQGQRAEQRCPAPVALCSDAAESRAAARIKSNKCRECVSRVCVSGWVGWLVGWLVCVCGSCKSQLIDAISTYRESGAGAWWIGTHTRRLRWRLVACLHRRLAGRKTLRHIHFRFNRICLQFVAICENYKFFCVCPTTTLRHKKVSVKWRRT